MVCFTLFCVLSAEASDKEVSWYAHGGVGWGMGWYTSSDIENELPNDYTIANLSLSGFGLLAHVGYRNLIQIEYDLWSTSAHSLMGDVVDFDDTGIPIREELDMKYKSSEYLIKINPFYFFSEDKPWYIVFGIGAPEFKSKKDGQKFSGSSTIFGLEYLRSTKNLSGAYGIKYSKITFDPTEFYSINYSKDISSNYILLYFTLAAGFGI